MVKRGEEELTLTAEIATLPDEILSRTELPQRGNEEQQPDDSAEAELQTLKLPDFSQEARFNLPPSNAGQEPGLLIWLAGANSEQDEELAAAWQAISHRDHFVFLIAHPADETGWASKDLEYLWRLTRTARTRWKVDRRRIAIGGQGKAGQLAYALAFRRRNAFNGVFGIDAPLPRTMRIPGRLRRTEHRFPARSSPSLSMTLTLAATFSGHNPRRYSRNIRETPRSDKSFHYSLNVCCFVSSRESINI